MQKTAIIIGAGPAGLTAAYRLLKDTDIKPILLEEASLVGGISKTICHDDNRMDIGGHRFFTKSPEVMQLWEEILPPQGAPARDDKLLSRFRNDYPADGTDPERDDRVLLKRRRVSRIYFKNAFFDYPLSLKFSTIANLGLFTTAKAGFGYLYAQMFKREENTLEDFMLNRFGRPLYRMFFEDYTQKVWGRHPSQISADWGEQRIKGLDLKKAVINMLKAPFTRGKSGQEVETSLIEEFYYPKYGPGQLYEQMAKEIVAAGGELHTGCTVTGITHEDGNITGVQAVKDGNPVTYQGDYYLSSMPIKDLVSAMALTGEVADIAKGLPYRDFITVGLLVDKLKIKNTSRLTTVSDIVPDCWIYIQDTSVRLGRLQIFNNWSPYMVKDLENTIWMGLEYFCDEGDEMWQMPAEAFIEMATKELCSIGIIDRDAVRDAVRHRVKKAYPAYFDSYAQIDRVIDALNGYENLFCIGRNGQHRYNNMDHSMLTAMRAVECIQGLTSHASIWQVNTEESYHEKKA